MWFLLIGVVMLAASYFEVGGFADLAWYWLLAPFAAALLWWEVVQPAIGWDKRQKRKEADAEQARRERIRQQFLSPGQAKRR